MKNSLRISILTRDSYTCQYCGRRAPQVDLHVEHIISRFDGGSDHPSNLVAACTDCNYGKSRRSLRIEELEPKDPLFFLDFEVGPLPKSVPYTATPRTPNQEDVAAIAIREGCTLKALGRCYWHSVRLEWRREVMLSDYVQPFYAEEDFDEKAMEPRCP